MATKTVTVKCSDGKTRTFKRGKQGRTPSPDKKVGVPFRLPLSWIAKMDAILEKTGETRQAFIEDAVREKLFPVTQELLIH